MRSLACQDISAKDLNKYTLVGYYKIAFIVMDDSEIGKYFYALRIEGRILTIKKEARTQNAQ